MDVLLRLAATPGEVVTRQVLLDQVWTRQLAGAEAFSSEPEIESAPRFSPDGSRVAFALGDIRHSRIVIQDVATRARTTFGDADAYEYAPVFVATATRIAFYRKRDSAC